MTGLQRITLVGEMAMNINECAGGGGGWLARSRSSTVAAATAGLAVTDGHGVMLSDDDGSAGGLPCRRSRSLGWHTEGGFGGGGGGCVGGGAGGGFTGILLQCHCLCTSTAPTPSFEPSVAS